MSGKNYETVNNQVKFENTLNPDAHTFFFQEPIEEVPDEAAVIMTQLFLKEGIKHCKGKGQAADKSEIKQLHFRDTFKPNKYINLNKDQNKSILESHMFLKEKIYGKIKGRTMA